MGKLLWFLFNSSQCNFVCIAVLTIDTVTKQLHKYGCGLWCGSAIISDLL